MKDWKQTIVNADKTTNHYSINTEGYNEVKKKAIEKDFKKATPGEVNEVIKEQQDIVKKLEIEDRVFHTPPQASYFQVKDHKPNFQNSHANRIINPNKPQIGKVSKQILSEVVEDIKEKTKVNLWKNTDAVIKWFENLQHKSNLKFIAFDIVDYYGSIIIWSNGPQILRFLIDIWGANYSVNQLLLMSQKLAGRP